MSSDVIGGALSNLNAAIEIVKAISAASGAIEKAQLKLQLSEVITALADAKVDLAEAMLKRQQQNDEIAFLRLQLENKAKVVRAFDAYYELDADRKPTGDPYCSHCWEVSHRLTHLTSAVHTSSETSCPACKAKYPKRLTPHRIHQHPEFIEAWTKSSSK